MIIKKIQPLYSFLECAAGNLGIAEIGYAGLETLKTMMIIDSVLYVPDMNENLFSLSQLGSNNVRYVF